MKVMHETWRDSLVKKVLDRHLLSEVPVSPMRKYASIVVLREFSSTAVLTTEGQMLDVELVRSGQKEGKLISRVVLQKRKQIAPERRTGRALLRQDTPEHACQYMVKMCGNCPDCLIYGFAATSGEGAQRSRVLTDSGFAIRSYESMQRSITLNAIEDTTKGGVAGSAFAEREHIRPQVFFPTIETVVDVTPSEFVYVLRNILATTRYGAESNRQGYVENHVVALVFGQAELGSNLSMTQRIYDRLYAQKGEQIHELPLDREEVTQAMKEVVQEMVAESYLPMELYVNEDLESILTSLRHIWHSEEANQEWLENLKSDHAAYLQKIKGKSK